LSEKRDSEFTKWFGNPSNRSDRERQMERTGISLDIRTRRQLRTLGYVGPPNPS